MTDLDNARKTATELLVDGGLLRSAANAILYDLTGLAIIKLAELADEPGIVARMTDMPVWDLGELLNIPDGMAQRARDVLIDSRSWAVAR